MSSRIGFFSIFVGSHSGHSFEYPCKMLGILKSEVTGNLADRAGGEKQPFLCGADDFVLYPFQSCLPRFFLNQVAEVVGRKAKFAQVFHDGPGLAGGEVAALIEGNAAPRQLGIERTAAVNPGSETTDGLFGIGIGKIKAG